MLAAERAKNIGQHMSDPLEGRGAGVQPDVRSNDSNRTMLPVGSLDLGALSSVGDAWEAAYAPHLEHLPPQETARLLYEVWHSLSFLPLSLSCASACASIAQRHSLRRPDQFLRGCGFAGLAAQRIRV